MRNNKEEGRDFGFRHPTGKMSVMIILKNRGTARMMVMQNGKYFAGCNLTRKQTKEMLEKKKLKKVM